MTHHEWQQQRIGALTRRHFLGTSPLALGAMAMHGFASSSAMAAGSPNPVPHMKPRAKHVIYLHMAGSPPQQDLFDFKPKLNEYHMKECPAELLEGKRFAFIKGVPKLLGTQQKFNRYGKSGLWFSDQVPHLAKMADEMCFVRSMHTHQFNHAPAQLLLHTGNQIFGGASFGAWATYGLGTVNANLPGFMVMVSGGTMPDGGKSLWGSSFLPSIYQGVQCRGEGDPILNVSNPPGMSTATRRRSLDTISKLNQAEFARYRDPETHTRIGQYELAFRMQASVPEVMDISRESKETLELYGAQPGKSSLANNCLLARRLVEQGVRFVQLFDWGWDIHGTGKHDDLLSKFPQKCREMDRPVAALLLDLKRRGLLDDTLVVWGGEFGRTPMNEARNGSTYLGRDHHPDCFTMWLAGGGVKRGFSYGQTDELGYGITENPVGVHDLQATLLAALGLNPYTFSFPYQGLNQRLIGPANTPRVIEDLFA